MLYFRWFLLVFLFNYSQFSWADWINLTGSETAPNIAEIYVFDDHVRVNLEVYISDLDKFEELLPDEWLNDSVGKRPSLQQRMHTFASERLQFITDKGVQLPAKLELLEPRMRVNRKSPFAGMTNPYTGQRVPEAPADKRVVYAEIIYPYPEKNKTQKPQQLTIVPPSDRQGNATVSIGFIAYHKSVPIIDFRYLSQQATLNLNWEDPWYSRFDNKNLKRHHRDPLMLFLYVEPRQVRLESLMRVRDIEEWSDFEFDNSSMTLEERLLLLKEHVRNYFAENNALQVDDNLPKPDVVRVEFLKATLSGLKVIDVTAKLDATTALVGVSQQYFIDALPQNVATHWSLFNQRVDRIPITATDPAGPFLSYVDKTDPEYVWHNFLKTYSEPVIHPVSVETGFSITLPYFGEKKIISWAPDQQEAATIINRVLENVRVAFIEKDPTKLLRELDNIISTKKSDVLKKELAKLYSPKVSGGGVGSVQKFNDLKVIDARELDGPDGFSATISGSAIINARHWGHVDQRLVQFQLLLDLIEVKQQWHIADLTVIDIKESK
ncbi:MAG: hypothetical protein KAJ32_07695 [Gammaproteobacteria bacterium]|nr:hypothetical protein [Gammaproteobacteria bacterium]